VALTNAFHFSVAVQSEGVLASVAKAAGGPQR